MEEYDKEMDAKEEEQRKKEELIKARMQAYESVFGSPMDDEEYGEEDDMGDFTGDFIPDDFDGDAI